mgnify:CR=1 FL=1
MQKISIIITFFIVFILVLSCTRDSAPEITCEGAASYDTNIKPIIDTNCSYSNCHDGTETGVFLDYAGIETYVNSNPGKFEDRVVNAADMPPSYALGPKMLAQDELDLIICWIEEDYPEN